MKRIYLISILLFSCTSYKTVYFNGPYDYDLVVRYNEKVAIVRDNSDAETKFFKVEKSIYKSEKGQILDLEKKFINMNGKDIILKKIK